MLPLLTKHWKLCIVSRCSVLVNSPNTLSTLILPHWIFQSMKIHVISYSIRIISNCRSNNQYTPCSLFFLLYMYWSRFSEDWSTWIFSREKTNIVASAWSIDILTPPVDFLFQKSLLYTSIPPETVCVGLYHSAQADLGRYLTQML